MSEVGTGWGQVIDTRDHQNKKQVKVSLQKRVMSDGHGSRWRTRTEEHDSLFSMTTCMLLAEQVQWRSGTETTLQWFEE